MVPDTDELVLFEGSQSVGDTYIFEPTGKEKVLGWLFAAAEVEEQDNVNKDVVDTAIAALQREYYRDPQRGILASFESALHQANLVLHDLVTQGIREWMGGFHVVVGVLAEGKESGVLTNGDEDIKMTLHVSTAGDGIVLMNRAHRVTAISAGLSHSPITDPLRTFSSVASGVIAERDILFFGTANFDQIFRNEDLGRFVADQTAETIALRLVQLHEDQKKMMPVAALIVAMFPQQQRAGRQRVPDRDLVDQRDPISAAAGLHPKKPLVISRSIGKRVLVLVGRIIVYLWQKVRSVMWPYVKAGSKKGGQALFVASKSAGRGVQSIAVRRMYQLKTGDMDSPNSPQVVMGQSKTSVLKGLAEMPRWLMKRAIHGIKALPKSSKIFAIVAIVLAVLLGVSMVLLQQKRAADVQIQQASEFLHEARTKKEAAETALIYDNRDQARALLKDAEELAERVQLTGLYEEQVTELSSGITVVQDRLDKVTRVSVDLSRVIGDFSDVMPGQQPTLLFYVNGALFSFDPGSNIIVRMGEDGAVAKVSSTTQGIGYFTSGTVHEADKTIVLVTDEPGIALYDTKTELMQKQEINLPSNESEVLAVATFGNRIYLFDRAANNVYGYSKTLRGYSGGNPWIVDSEFPVSTIEDIGVDGYIYTLHKDGSVRKLLKGEQVDFELEEVEPSISGDASLVINEDLRHLYVFDPANKRVVVFDTVGNLSRQIFFGEDSNVRDVAVDMEEKTLYVLDGTQVKAISLKE